MANLGRPTSNIVLGENILPDGGFESFDTCGPRAGEDICYYNSSPGWIGIDDAGAPADSAIIFYSPYSHSGHTVGVITVAYGSSGLSGTLKPVQPLNTVPGQKYQVSFFHGAPTEVPSNSSTAFAKLLWNGQVVFSTPYPVANTWKQYQVNVTAVGQDLLAFHGGTSSGRASYIDDVSVYAV